MSITSAASKKLNARFAEFVDFIKESPDMVPKSEILPRLAGIQETLGELERSFGPYHTYTSHSLAKMILLSCSNRFEYIGLSVRFC